MIENVRLISDSVTTNLSMKNLHCRYQSALSYSWYSYFTYFKQSTSYPDALQGAELLISRRFTNGSDHIHICASRSWIPYQEINHKWISSQHSYHLERMCVWIFWTTISGIHICRGGETGNTAIAVLNIEKPYQSISVWGSSALCLQLLQWLLWLHLSKLHQASSWDLSSRGNQGQVRELMFCHTGFFHWYHMKNLRVSFFKLFCYVVYHMVPWWLWHKLYYLLKCWNFQKLFFTKEPFFYERKWSIFWNIWKYYFFGNVIFITN